MKPESIRDMRPGDREGYSVPSPSPFVEYEEVYQDTTSLSYKSLVVTDIVIV
jgi:hypothetical protein